MEIWGVFSIIVRTLYRVWNLKLQLTGQKIKVRIFRKNGASVSFLPDPKNEWIFYDLFYQVVVHSSQFKLRQPL
jgi:hypothetical protein